MINGYLGLSGALLGYWDGVHDGYPAWPQLIEKVDKLRSFFGIPSLYD